MGIVDYICSLDYSYVPEIIAAWILATALFILLILYISKYPHKKTVPLKAIFLAMFIGGTLMYCAFNYAAILNAKPNNRSLVWTRNENGEIVSLIYTLPYVIMTSIMDVFMMFYGRGSSEAFYSFKLAEYPLAVVLFCLIQFVTLYTAAGALFIRFGNDLLRWIRIRTSKISEVALIFGVNDDSIVFGRNISDAKESMLVYVDSVIGEDFAGSIRAMGGVAYSDKDAMKATAQFLKRIRIKPGGARLRLFCLSNDYDKNLQYASEMSESLKNYGILPEQTELLLLGSDEWKGIYFQADGEKYGYGSVQAFDEHEMTARLLIHKYPPCNAINFDDSGRASENMNVLIVGFGRIGHEVLRKIFANGHFEGSEFHAFVYDPNFEHRSGFIMSQYPKMFAGNVIRFEPQNGRSGKFFDFLEANAPKLKYIVVCIDDRELARDIAVHTLDRLQKIGHPLNVYTCDSKCVRCYSQHAEENGTHWLYDSDILYSDELDGYAKELNHRYTKGISANEDWKQCDYFSRMSSRASVDYLIPLIRRVMKNSDRLTHEQRENLSRSEHLRWCAFHYTFGYDVMSSEEFAQRVRDKQNGAKIKTTKDSVKMTHVCLVDWDKLDEISRIENSITRGNKSYKDSDRENVDMVTELLRPESNTNTSLEQ